MQATPMFIFYVTDPAASARFYADALGAPVVYEASDFAILPLGQGARLGLWRTENVQPRAGLAPGGAELDIALADGEALMAAEARLAAQGVTILQPLTTLGFGQAVTVADPDGHRLRLYVPAMP
ncbi:VOC family protein [Pararhodobacter aggregans]|nr:VOC family protein [Pararhodobacter aggregans]PTW98916.1 catechol 2,3-dioxygenase-like lactoylglutathione lyase family enzyme [Pararhodobacter aggregans]